MQNVKKKKKVEWDGVGCKYLRHRASYDNFKKKKAYYNSNKKQKQKKKTIATKNLLYVLSQF